MPEVYQSSNAAANITKMFDSIVEAQKSSMDAKNEILKYQINKQADLQANKQKLQQENESGINAQNMQMDWLSKMNSGNGTNEVGKADAGTSAKIGSVPQFPGSPVPQTPPMTMANPAQQPQNDAASQLTMPQAQGQPPMTPAGQAPMSTPQEQPQPPSVQYTNLGYQPVESQQLAKIRKDQQQPINQADVAYIQALQKAKAGTASQDELSMIHKMNSRDENGQQPPLSPMEQKNSENLIQQNLRAFEQKVGWPKGSAMFNPTAKPGEIPIKVNPVWQSKQEALNRMQMEQPDKYAARAEQDLMRVFSYKSGALGVQDAKIGQAMHIKQLFDLSYDPKTGVYNLKGPMFAEATQGLATLVSNSNQTSEGQRNEIKQRTAVGDYNGALTYILGVPKNATSQEVAKMYIDAVDRQALTAQYIKEKDLSEIQKLDSMNQLKRVDPERAANLYKANFGVDYREYMKKPWAERMKMINNGDMQNGGEAQGGGQGGSARPTIVNPKTGQTMTLSADGKSWQ